MVRLCACGCGITLPQPERPSRIAKYLRGHNKRNQEDTEESVRFARNFTPGNSEECWEWTGGVVNKGYGHFVRNKDSSGKRKQINASRMSYMLDNGLSELDSNIHVLHRCDNPPCVNPKHLFVGSNMDNIEDRMSKERSAQGETHPGHRLKETEVLEILRRSREGEDKKDIASDFKISTKYLGRIVRGERWSYLHRKGLA